MKNTRQMNHARKVHLKQQLILLFFLFLTGGLFSPVWADGTGKEGDPYKGDIDTKYPSDYTFYLSGVTAGNLNVSGDRIVIFSGENKLGKSGSVPFRMPSNSTVTFRGNPVTGGTFSANAVQIGSTHYPAISGSDNSYGKMGTLRLEGAMFVNAYSGYVDKVPGIGAANDNDGAYGHESGGSIVIKDGAFLNMTVTYKAKIQLPKLTIENFGAVNPRRNSSSGSEVLEDYPNFEASYPKCFISYTQDFFTVNYVEQQWATMEITYQGTTYKGKVRINEKGNDQLGRLPLYFASAKPDYMTLNGIPVSLEGNTSRVGAVTVGGTYLETDVLPSDPVNNMVLQVTNYPFSGTVTPGANITFDGNNKNLCTVSAGLNLNANASFTLELKNMKVPSGNKLIIGKKVFLASGIEKCDL